MKQIALIACLALAACGARPPQPDVTRAEASFSLNPNETPAIRATINRYADHYGVPRSLVHRVIQRESDYRPAARNGPYYGMMQILPQTARTMGHDGPASELLTTEGNLRWAVKYLRGAWMVSDGDEHDAMMWYARGYYYEAKNRCLLVETGLNTRETARHCKG
ncbi:lytic transglycosylase domain-containing protein [Palleronia sediminis]|uniref:Lytic transglycosylase domain-containing protein n=1 Tax=Palleronia sediminis TaxID=2547833 RepID=A0A4R6A4M6_9RHOB|nr:lytic transglycosylase domain-containing protein [Palleronia sediminis]TDL76056.1 lytic transglycosylase domain-containing protein [Palleronia sediminis]